MVPALNDRTGGAGACGQVLKSIAVGDIDVIAGSGIGDCSRHVGVGAVCRDTEHVLCVGLQVGHEEGLACGGGGCGHIGPVVGVGTAVVDIPRSLLIAGDPHQFEITIAVRADVYDRRNAGGPGDAFAATARHEACVAAPIGLAGTGGIHRSGVVGRGTEDTVGHGRTGGSRYGLVAEYVGRAVGRAAVVDNGHTEIADAIVLERTSVKVEVVPARSRAVERPHIDQLQLAVGNKGGVGGHHVGACGVGQVDGAVGGMGHGLGVGIVEANTVECGWTRDGDFIGAEQMLTVAVVVALVEGHDIACRGAGSAQHNGVGRTSCIAAGGIPGHTGKGLRAEGGDKGLAGAVVALGSD